MKIKLLVLSICILYSSAAFAAPANPPGYEPTLPVQDYGEPHLPAYLPNGAVNLDETWIQDGGARLYWNTVRIPRQLKMGGNVWIDPALVPELFQQQKAQAKRRYYTPRRKAQVKRVAKVKIPKTASSRKLTPPIPLPVTPVPGNDIQPLKAPQAVNELPAVPIQPPRLQ